MASDDGGAKTRTVVIYPRDKLAAIKQAQELARGGVLPEHYAANLSAAENVDDEKALDPLTALMPVRTNFSQITATAPDGTKITATVEREGEVIEGEIEEK